MGGCSKPKAPNYEPVASAQIQAAEVAAESSRKAIEEFRRQHDLSLEEIRRQYDQTRSDFMPWREVGLDALGEITKGLASGRFSPGEFKGLSLSEFVERPGYAFRVAEGEKAIARNAAAMGIRKSGVTGKALIDHGQKMASEEYDAAYSRKLGEYGIQRENKMIEFDRLSALAGVGQSATGSIAGAGSGSVAQIVASGRNYASNYANQLRYAADARGNAAIGAAQAMVEQQKAKNAAAQQNFNNLLGVAQLGLGAWGISRMGA